MSFLFALALLSEAPPGDGQLLARPVAKVEAPAMRGDIRLGADAQLYLPHGAAPVGGWPLLVVLPGTGGKARRLVTVLAPAAEQQRFALLGLDPGPSGNFETIDRFFDAREAHRKDALADWPRPSFDRDVKRLDDALRGTFMRVPIGRVGLLGYSHGGSFALSIGLANPQLFGTIEALSPGLLLLPTTAKGGQAVFLSHGKRDETQPYRRTACAMTPKLKQLGYAVRFRARAGGHALEAADLVAALEHFLTDGEAGPLAPPPGC